MVCRHLGEVRLGLAGHVGRQFLAELQDPDDPPQDVCCLLQAGQAERVGLDLHRRLSSPGTAQCSQYSSAGVRGAFLVEGLHHAGPQLVGGELQTDEAGHNADILRRSIIG